MAREQLVFVEVDPSTLNAEQRRLWDALLEVKRQFKASLQTLAPEGKQLLFSEKYNKLKIAIAPASKPTQSSQSLAEFLASQASSGRKV